jgi:hypothetical protein
MNPNIKKRIQRWGLSCAVWLDRRTGRLSAGKKKTGVALFCLASGGISLYIIILPMISSSFHKGPVKIQRPFIPNHIGKTEPLPDSRISPKLYQRIEAFKNNDSLMNAYPAISRARLLDSIHTVEQLYQSQSKK